MKYYSDKTKKIYETIEDLQSAEAIFDKEYAEKLKEKEVKKARVAEIEKARAEAEAAAEKYNKLIREFIRDYKYYHSTISKIDDNIEKLFNLLF